MEFTWAAEQSAYFHASHHSVLKILGCWGLPHVFLSNGITWVKDSQKYHNEIQRHFCIGQLLNPHNTANRKVSSVLCGLSPLCPSICPWLTNGECGRPWRTRWAFSRKIRQMPLALLFEDFRNWHIRPPWFMRVWIDFPDVAFQRLSDEASVP